MSRMRLVLPVALCLATAATPVLATGLKSSGQEPAVSRPNGKVAFRGGAMDDEASGLAQFSYSLPVGHAFGIQFDGLAGLVDDDGVGGAGLHLFWRNPSKGLLGGYVSANTIGGDDFYRFLGEAHAYRGRFSLEGAAGWEEAGLDSGAFWLGQVGFYPKQNLRLTVGALYTHWADGDHFAPGTLGKVGLEYQVRSDDRRAVALFAEGRFGDDYYAAWTGVRFYFGDDKSLLRRHREDDPAAYILDVMEIDPNSPLGRARNARGGGTPTTPPPPEEEEVIE